jgi:hypothetical protein
MIINNEYTVYLVIEVNAEKKLLFAMFTLLIEYMQSY